MAVLDPGGTDRTNIAYEDWPIPGTEYVRLYLNSADRSLNTAPATTESSISYQAPSGQAEFTIAFDKDTQLTGYIKARLWVETRGGEDSDLYVLVEKLDASGKLLVPGEESAQHYLPVPPPGAPGQIRVSMRELDPERSTPFLPVLSLREEKKVPGGEIVSVDIAIQPVSMMFHKGEKLRLIAGGTKSKEWQRSASIGPSLNRRRF